MERLTWDDYNGGCYAQDILQQDYDTATVFTGEPIYRLAAYERTEHTPEECAAAFEELAAYRAAEQDGTLLRMPCKQYTTIYYILDKTVYVGWYLAKAGQTTSLILQDRIEMGVCWCNDDSWFFTSEEAEITLKEQEAVNV